MRRIAAGVALLVLTGLLAGPGAALARPAATPPRGFFGVVPQAPLGESDLVRMQGTVETLRLPVYWSQCEPRPGEYEFGDLDAEIGSAAAHRIAVLPVIYGTPAWLGPDPARPPLGGRAMAAWKRFLGVLVTRYGPGGKFWQDRSTLPIHRWQVWNEPNFRLFWAGRISPRGYGRLVRAAATTIRRVDAGAKIVLAGVAPVGDGMKTWVFLRRLLRVPGVRKDFDFAAVHPYSATLGELNYQMRRVRSALAAGGAREVPLLVTEVGVASQGNIPSVFVEGPLGQASFLQDAYSRLLRMRRRWRIAGVYWFSWRDMAAPDVHCAFCQGAGLLEADGWPKPAWTAFRGVVAAARHG